MIWGKTKYSTDIRRRWQHILKKLPAVIGVARRSITPFEHGTDLLRVSFYVTLFNTRGPGSAVVIATVVQS